MRTIAIDSSIFIGDNLGFKSSKYEELKKLAIANKIKILVPDLVIREVKANIKSSIGEAQQAHQSFTKKARILRNLPDRFPNLFDEFSHEEMHKELSGQFDSYLKESKTVILDSSSLCDQKIMDKYFNGEPPFKSGGTTVLKSDDKRFEFPDAIAIGSIEKWATENKTSVEVVSADHGWQEACTRSERLTHCESIQNFIDQTLQEISNTAAVEKAAQLQAQNFMQMITDRISNFGFYLGNHNGEVKDTRNFKAESIEISVVAYDAESGEGNLWISSTVTFDAEVYYGDDASATWDSEDKELFYHHYVDTTVEHELWVEAEVDFHFDSATKEFEILSLSIVDPQGDIDVSPDDGYPYK